MSRSGAEIRASESQSKTMQDRITAVEKHLGQLCDTFASYTRKTARVRDKGDQLSKEIAEYAEYEKWNPSLREGLTNFAENLSAVQDYREAQVNRLEKKVVSQLSGYGILCKQTKNDLKGSFTAQHKEQQLKKKLEQLKAKSPQNRQQIMESDLQRASLEASRCSHTLEQHVDKFEKNKIESMKKLLKEFVQIELSFHAKALELYTKCFKTLEVVDPESDMEEFRKQVRPVNSSRQQLARTASQQSLNSQEGSINTSVNSQRNPQQPQNVRPQSTPVTNGIKRETMDDDDSEDYDDDDDDDDDDEDDEITEAESTARSSNTKRR